jgi:hypothetical protein
MNRRGFLGGLSAILASGFAPAAIGSGVLMPVRPLVWAPRSVVEIIGVDRGFTADRSLSLGVRRMEDGSWRLLEISVMPADKSWPTCFSFSHERNGVNVFRPARASGMGRR